MSAEADRKDLHCSYADDSTCLQLAEMLRGIRAENIRINESHAKHDPNHERIGYYELTMVLANALIMRLKGAS